MLLLLDDTDDNEGCKEIADNTSGVVVDVEVVVVVLVVELAVGVVVVVVVAVVEIGVVLCENISIGCLNTISFKCLYS